MAIPEAWGYQACKGMVCACALFMQYRGDRQAAQQLGSVTFYKFSSTRFFFRSLRRSAITMPRGPSRGASQRAQRNPLSTARAAGASRTRSAASRGSRQQGRNRGGRSRARDIPEPQSLDHSPPAGQLRALIRQEIQLALASVVPTPAPATLVPPSAIAASTDTTTTSASAPPATAPPAAVQGSQPAPASSAPLSPHPPELGEWRFAVREWVWVCARGAGFGFYSGAHLFMGHSVCTRASRIGRELTGTLLSIPLCGGAIFARAPARKRGERVGVTCAG